MTYNWIVIEPVFVMLNALITRFTSVFAVYHTAWAMDLLNCLLKFRFEKLMEIIALLSDFFDRLCGLVVRVSGYRYRGLGFHSRRYQIF